jgi:alkanesulfonate monooxygenase SsuD/methylene tetrahydromethanopterin reductase-like flavin-dependent oxidoreductase (luciferase family)
VHDAYDMNHHTEVGTAQTAALTPEFIDAYGVVGSSAECVARLDGLFALGLDRLVLLGASAGTDRQSMMSARSRLENEVLPAVR